MKRAARRIFVVSATLWLVGSSCSTTHSLPELHNGIEIGMRRGGAWVTYTVKPPYIIGAVASIRLRRGEMTGSLAGRRLNMQILPDGITGSLGATLDDRRNGSVAQTGTIELAIDGGPDDVEISGLWDGERVHFSITEDSLRGTIPAHFTHGNVPNDGNQRGMSCQYVLDKTAEDGARSGISICSGLPEDTLIEIPRPITGWLTRNELVGVLLAMLSAPPLTSMEGTF